MVLLALGAFNVSVKYLFKPKGRRTWHYRRHVPSGVKAYYDQPHILKSLQTEDDVEAAKLATELNRRYEDEFSRLKRGLPKTLAQPTYELALGKLHTFGLYRNAINDQSAPADIATEFLDHMEDKLRAVVPKEQFEAIWYKGEAVPEGLMEAVDSAALELVQGKYRPRASFYVDSYISLRGRTEDKKFVNDAKRALKCLLEFLPDKPPGDYTRADVRRLVSCHIDKGDVKTATLHRRITILRAMFNKVAKEHELKADMLHPFNDFTVPGLREDAKERQDFSTEELARLRQAIAQRKPQIQSLAHLMLETGLRVNECCGLKVEDVVLDAETPYVIVQKNPFRRLKTTSSRRYIPLVGVALNAMTRECEGKEFKEWIFPSYIDEAAQTTKNTSASAAVNKRIRAVLGQGAPTCHSFRHSFNSRLRNVECPKDIRDELGGWASSVSDRYGSPADIKIKQRYLLQSIDAPSGIDWG